MWNIAIKDNRVIVNIYPHPIDIYFKFKILRGGRIILYKEFVHHTYDSRETEKIRSRLNKIVTRKVWRMAANKARSALRDLYDLQNPRLPLS
jgi:hypothetical protein